jgi:hypothetical protein
MFHTSPKLTSGPPRITSPGRAFLVNLPPDRPTSGFPVMRASNSPIGSDYIVSYLYLRSLCDIIGQKRHIRHYCRARLLKQSNRAA